MDEKEGNLKSLRQKIRKDGKLYTLKADVNRFFFPKEYCKFEDALKSKQKHTIHFLLNTGCRINEARNVSVSDVDFVNKRMVIRKVKRKAKKKETRGKIRTIPISSKFVRYLNRYVNNNNLTETDTFRLLSTPAINIAMKKTAEKIGLSNPEDFSAHTIRKTLEVWLMSLGVRDIPLTAHFGHDIKTAASHYVSPDVFSNEEKMHMRDIIGDLYWGAR